MAAADADQPLLTSGPVMANHKLCEALLAVGATTTSVRLEEADTADVVGVLVRAGVDVNAWVNGGGTALHSVASASACRRLLAVGGDPCATNDAGQTPLHVARDAGTVVALVSAGACVWCHRNCSNPDCTRALPSGLGVVPQSISVVAGAKVNARD